MMEIEPKIVTVDVNEAFIVKADAGDLCRLCANTDNQLIPIYRGEGLEHNIPTKIEQHLPIIKVTELDKLPLQICYQCASTLIAWHNLYEGCREADKRLKDILSTDEKLYQTDEPFEAYVDDYRDDYEDQSRTNFENIPLISTPSTSSLPTHDILKNSSTEITQIDGTKTFNETELDSTDERSSLATTCKKVVHKGPATSRKKAVVQPPKSSRRSDAKVGDLFYKCSECTKVFLKKHNLERHALLHSTAKPKPETKKSDERLPDDDEDVADWTSQCEHVVLNGQKFLKCIKCGFLSKSVNTKLTRHLKRHEAEYRTCCEVCGKQFRNIHQLTIHTKRKHENDRKFKCDICKRAFFEINHLEQHKRIHTGERPYVCDECGKTFVQQSSLFVHKKFHKGEKSNICRLCGRGFITTSGLFVHIRRHTGERNHVCVHCGKGFVSTSQLKCHVSSHFDDRPFECVTCGSTFKLRKHWKVHTNSHSKCGIR